MASQDGGADAWGGADDGSSLFEGMVLFAPEPAAAAEEAAPVPVLDPDPDPEPRPDADAGAAASSSSSAPPPLDEDLFSDLTLLAPQEPLSLEQQQSPLPQGEDRSHAAPAPAPSPPAPAAALFWQPSSSSLRKKKRAVRIGYGRSPQPEPPSPLPPATVRASTAATMSATSIPFMDASPQPAAPPTPDQYPEQLADVYANGDEVDTEVVVVPDTNPPHLDEELKEEDDQKADEVAGDAVVRIEERLALLRSQISSKLDSIQQRAAAVVARRRQLAGRRRKVAEEVTSVASRHKDLERELEEACEAEDFERAEKISDSLAALEKEKDRLLTALRNAELDYDSVDSELQGVLESHIAAEEEAAALLKQFAKVN